MAFVRRELTIQHMPAMTILAAMGLLSGPTASVACAVMVEPSDQSRCLVHTALNMFPVLDLDTMWQWPAIVPTVTPLVQLPSKITNRQA